jgi:hypothetical protein
MLRQNLRRLFLNIFAQGLRFSITLLVVAGIRNLIINGSLPIVVAIDVFSVGSSSSRMRLAFCIGVSATSVLSPA